MTRLRSAEAWTGSCSPTWGVSLRPSRSRTSSPQSCTRCPRARSKARARWGPAPGPRPRRLGARGAPAKRPAGATSALAESAGKAKSATDDWDESTRKHTTAQQAAIAETHKLSEAAKRGTAETNALTRSARDAAAGTSSLAKAAKEAGEEAGGLGSGWQRAERAFQGFLSKAGEFWESSSRFGEAYRNIREPVSDTIEGLSQAAESTARRASEQGRLDRVQTDLGLSFRHAQDYAGGFARETELATAALTLQGQGLRVTQRELDALARLAMRRASDSGKEFSEVMENAVESVTEGGDALGKLAPELLTVADSSHTAGQRLAAMVEAADRLPPATRDARSEFERYTASVQSSQRQLAAGFVEELAHLDSLTAKTHDARDAADDWNTSMRAVGSTRAPAGPAALGKSPTRKEP